MNVRLLGIVCILCSSFCSGEIIPKLLLITMDGFGHKYLETLPDSLIGNLKYFAHNGVKAKWMENVFPSFTYPNFYTMITGLYPESHGLVHNTMYDGRLNDYFTIDNVEDNFDPKWYTAETIYYTNHAAGTGRYSGSVAFPAGVTPSKGVSLDHVIPNFFWMNVTDARHSHYEVDTMVSWFQDQNKPINLGLLYFGEPDEVSHKYGPDSNETHEVIGKVNDAIGYLKTKLDDIGLLDKINIIITADHGQVNYKGFVNIDDCSNRSLYSTNMGSAGIVVFVLPVPGCEEEVYSAFQNCGPHLSVYKKDGPELSALHYRYNDRIAPIVLEPEVGYIIINNDYHGNANGSGHHGYNPSQDTDLYPLFIASGPAFKKGIVSEPIQIVDLYPLMCEVLGIEPAPNNGSLERARHLLIDQSGSNSSRSTITGLVVMAIFLLTCMML